jgi:hypothetical protein
VGARLDIVRQFLMELSISQAEGCWELPGFFRLG